MPAGAEAFAGQARLLGQVDDRDLDVGVVLDAGRGPEAGVAADVEQVARFGREDVRERLPEANPRNRNDRT